MGRLYQGDRLRSGRYSQTQQIYLVTAVICNRRPWFSELRTGRMLVHQFREAQFRGLAQSLAWVVMPDHFH